MHIDIYFLLYHISNSFVRICINYSSSLSLGSLSVGLVLLALGLQLPARPAASPKDPACQTYHCGLLFICWLAG